MGISRHAVRGAQTLCGLTLAFAAWGVTAQQLVNSDTTGASLPTQTAGFFPLDMSADGRYVLFSNYSQERFSLMPSPDQCRVFRKDRQTGELLTVFESDPQGFTFCNGAKISADGSRVAAAPEGPAGPCSVIALPDGQSGYDCAEVTALLVRDLGIGADKKLITRWVVTGSRIAITPTRYPGAELISLSADATVAVLVNIAINAGTVGQVFSVADLRSNTLEEISVQPANGNETVSVTGTAVSQDGARLAVSAQVRLPCLPESTSASCAPPVYCDQTGRCDVFDQTGNSWWGFGLPLLDAPTSRIYVIDRMTGAQIIPAALDALPGSVDLAGNAWSAHGNFLSWIELPKSPPIACSSIDAIYCAPSIGCSGTDCELTVRRYNFSSGRLRTRQTTADPDSLSTCGGNGPYTADCKPHLSRDGNGLLFGRLVTRPFGGEWQASVPPLSAVCVTKASLDGLEGEPESIDCPPLYYPYPSGPGYAVNYRPPINWYLQDILTGHTTLVSITDAGQLFQSSGALLADNGRVAMFRSRDPRLNNRVSNAAQFDESRLPDGCFWSPAGSSSNLLVATNDNTLIDARTDFYAYPETPVFCPVSYPLLPANLYALDLVRGINLAAMTISGIGSGTVPMQTWIANAGKRRATMLGVDINISGLGDGGRVRVAADTPCEIYSPATATADSSVLLRCELPALAPLEFRQLRWSVSSDKLALLKIDTKISGNERETRPANNADIDYAAVWPRGWTLNWFGSVR